MSVAATEPKPVSRTHSGDHRPVAAGNLRIESWSEESYELTLKTVQDLSSGALRRDPAAKPRPRRPKKTEPELSGVRRGRSLTRWQIDLQKRAFLTNKSVEELREEERLRGQQRRKLAKKGTSPNVPPNH